MNYDGFDIFEDSEKKEYFLRFDKNTLGNLNTDRVERYAKMLNELHTSLATCKLR
jgi:hypothetical protein